MPSRNYGAMSKAKQYKGSKTSPVGSLAHSNGSNYSYGVDSISDNSFTNPLILNVGNTGHHHHRYGSRTNYDGSRGSESGGSKGYPSLGSGGGGTLSASSSTTSSSSASFTPPPLRKTPEPVR